MCNCYPCCRQLIIFAPPPPLSTMLFLRIETNFKMCVENYPKRHVCQIIFKLSQEKSFEIYPLNCITNQSLLFRKFSRGQPKYNSSKGYFSGFRRNIRLLNVREFISSMPLQFFSISILFVFADWSRLVRMRLNYICKRRISTLKTLCAFMTKFGVCKQKVKNPA